MRYGAASACGVLEDVVDLDIDGADARAALLELSVASDWRRMRAQRREQQPSRGAPKNSGHATPDRSDWNEWGLDGASARNQSVASAIPINSSFV